MVLICWRVLTFSLRSTQAEARRYRGESALRAITIEAQYDRPRLPATATFERSYANPAASPYDRFSPTRHQSAFTNTARATGAPAGKRSDEEFADMTPIPAGTNAKEEDDSAEAGSGWAEAQE